jgi:DNA-binding CsgD family transcriptional regulator
MMLRPKPSYEFTAQTLQNAAVDPTQWATAMDVLSSYAGSVGAVLLAVKGRGPGTPHSSSLDEPYLAYFREQWHLRDERDVGLPLIRKKGIVVDQDFVTPDLIARSDYYRGFLDRYNNNWSATIGFADPDDEWTLGFQRGRKQGPFEQKEQDDLVRLAGPLSQAAALARSVSYANAASALDAYESIGCASFLMDQLGRVVRYNAQAELLLGDGLQLSHRTLRCVDPADNLALENLVESCRIGASHSVADPFVVVRRKRKRALVIRAINLAGLAAMSFASARMILLVSDLEKRPPATSAKKLMQVFGLTGSEATLVINLCNEVPLSEAAELMNISFETARTHLKRILSKTQTRRQQDLLMLVHRLRP